MSDVKSRGVFIAFLCSSNFGSNLSILLGNKEFLREITHRIVSTERT